MLRTQITIILMSSALATSVFAKSIQVVEGRWDGSKIVYHPAEGGFHSRSFGFHSYDNWRYPGRLEEPGDTVLSQILRIGGDEVGDDTHLVSWQPNRIADFGITMWNFSTTQTITDIDVALRFYNSSHAILGEAVFTSSGFIPPGGGVMAYTSGGLALHWFLPTEESMFMTIQFSNAVNFDVSQMGLIYGGPVTTGSSSRFAQNITTGQAIDLGSDQSNLGFFIDTIPIPSPSVGIGAAGALCCGIRRRRKS